MDLSGQIDDREQMLPAQARAALVWCAVAVVMLLVVEGMRSRGDSSSMTFGLAPIIALPTVAASAGSWALRATRLARLAFVLLPIAAGLMIVTWLVGWTVFPGVLAWWLAGALICAVPFVALATRAAPHRKGTADARWRH